MVEEVRERRRIVTNLYSEEVEGGAEFVKKQMEEHSLVFESMPIDIDDIKLVMDITRKVRSEEGLMEEEWCCCCGNQIKEEGYVFPFCYHEYDRECMIKLLWEKAGVCVVCENNIRRSTIRKVHGIHDGVV